MSSKFNSSRRVQQPPKVCKKSPIEIAIAADLWPLPFLTVYVGWRSTDPDNPFLQVDNFTIPKSIYPNTWEGYSAPTGRRFFVHLARANDDEPFDFALTLYQDHNPIKQILWNRIPINTDEPFTSPFLTRGPPDVVGLVHLLITE